MYINASQVNFVGVVASNNKAQQGSGVFSVATSSNFESCIFEKNTAITVSSQSKFSYAQSSYSLGVFEKFPDAAAALGAGLFVSALQQLKKCTFIDNLAIAGISQGSGWNSATKSVSGGHALGSGVFAMQVSANAQVSQNQWIRSKQLCGGPCVAGGSFFIGTIGDSAVFDRMTFDSCETSAIASVTMDQFCSSSAECLGVAPALGAGISFISALATTAVKFNDIQSRNSFIQSVGLAVGGALHSAGSIGNALISNTVVENMVFKCVGFKCTVRGAGICMNVASKIQIFDTSVSSLSLSCAGSGCRIMSGAIYIVEGSNAAITDTNLNDVSARASGANSLTRGVGFNFGSISSSIISGGAFNNVKLSCNGLSCAVAGGVLHTDMSRDSSFLSFNFSSISAVCSSSLCKVYGSHVFLVNTLRVVVGKIRSFDASIQAENQIFGGIFVVFSGADLSLSDVLLQNVLNKCSGVKCDMRGSLLHFDTSVRLLLSNICISSSLSQLSVSASSYVPEDLFHVSFIFLRLATDTSINNVRVSDSAISCVGSSCMTTGVLSIAICNNCIASNLLFVKLSCSTSGENSRSFGCCVNVESAFYSQFSNVMISNVSVSVLGAFIGGGAIAFQSPFLSSSLQNVSSENVIVNCSNPKCSSSALPFTCICQLRGGLVALSKMNSSFVRNVTSRALTSQCFGHFCSVLGGAVEIGVFLQSEISRLDISFSSASAEGYSSSASGACIFVTLSDRSSIQNASFSAVSCTSNGELSTSMGAGLGILAGNARISDFQLVNLSVSCTGRQCNSLGGGISVVSSLSKTARSPGYQGLYTTSSVTVYRVLCQSASASCFGIGCLASGAGIATKRSFRSTDTLGLVTSFLVDEVPDVVRFQMFDSQFINCSVFSDSNNATLTGGTLSFAPAIVSISACVIHQSKIQNSNSPAFIAGGAIFALGSECSVDLTQVQLTNSSVPHPGLGGAFYVGAGTRARLVNSTVSNNSARRGGGIYVEASSLELRQSTVDGNRAVDRGAAIFCASIDTRCSSGTNSSCIGGGSSISVVASSITDNIAEVSDAVGSSIFVAGAVALNIDESTSVSVKGTSAQPTDTKRDQTGVYLSAYAGAVGNPTTICQDGTMLRITPVTSSSLAVSASEPTAEVLSVTNCFPLCIGVPQYTPFLVSQGMVVSCTPCPKDTYSLKTSNSTTDTVNKFCER